MYETPDPAVSARRFGQAWNRILILAPILFVVACGSSNPGEPSGDPILVISSTTPDSAAANSFDFTLEVIGSGFIEASVVRWNGVDRMTEYKHPRRLLAIIHSIDLETVGTAKVTVHNPADGGGTTSNAVDFTVFQANPVPEISGLDPEMVAQGAGDTFFQVTGGRFVEGSLVLWNRRSIPTKFIDDRHLIAQAPASRLTDATRAEIIVANPLPGGGLSTAALFTVQGDPPGIQQVANRIIYSPVRHRIYASIPGSAPTHPNSVISIHPAGFIDGVAFVGNEPKEMALSDNGQYLYVSLHGDNAIRRVDLATFTAGLQFEVKGKNWPTAYRAEDLVVLEGQPGSVAASVFNRNTSPRHLGVVIFDDGVPRDSASQGHTGSNRIERSAAPDTLYGWDEEGSSSGFRKLAVSAAGIREVAVRHGLWTSGADMEYAANRVYADDGVIVDPAEFRVLVDYNVAGILEPDPGRGRVYVIPRGSFQIRGYDIYSGDWLEVTSVLGLEEPLNSLVLWGSRGLAYPTANWIVIWPDPLVTQ